MIIFTPLKDFPIELLEYKKIGQVVQLNLSSYYSDIQNLDMLIPSPEYISEDVLSGDCSDATFDMEYHKFILDNNNAFCQLMSIMVPEFTLPPGTLVQVLIQNSNYRDIITESLMKLIQQRYGHNSYYVNVAEDLLYIEESDFSIPGLFALENDLARWRSMMPVDNGDLYE